MQDVGATGISRWRVVAVWVIGIIAVVAYFALGMPGMGHGANGSAGVAAMRPSEMAVDVDDFAARMEASDAFVVNVHVPDEGSIAGTDEAIPYDQVVGDDRLPTNRSTPILLYCKTGRMSGDAAVALMEGGYRNVVHLDGGMDAWTAAGRPLE